MFLILLTVILIVYIAQLLVGNMSIDLSRGDIGMTEHYLDRADVGVGPGDELA